MNALSASVTGDRSQYELQQLKRILRGPIFSQSYLQNLDDAELNTLCNECDIFLSEQRTLLFLQGDPGSCHFVVVKGKIEFYFERNKDREREIQREFDKLRGKPVHDRIGSELGGFMRAITPGYISSGTNVKPVRSISAVTTPGTMLLIVFEHTFENVLRRYKASDEELQRFVQLFHELPYFQHYDHSKLSALVTSVTRKVYQPKAIMAQRGSKIENLYVIFSGEAKVVLDDHKNRNVRIPRFGIAQLGRGRIIGEREIQNQIKYFEMTCIAATECIVLVMDLHTYEENALSSKSKMSPSFRQAERVTQMIEKLHDIRTEKCRSLEQVNKISEESIQKTPRKRLSGKKGSRCSTSSSVQPTRFPSVQPSPSGHSSPFEALFAPPTNVGSPNHVTSYPPSGREETYSPGYSVLSFESSPVTYSDDMSADEDWVSDAKTEASSVGLFLKSTLSLQTFLSPTANRSTASRSAISLPPTPQQPRGLPARSAATSTSRSSASAPSAVRLSPTSHGRSGNLSDFFPTSASLDVSTRPKTMGAHKAFIPQIDLVKQGRDYLAAQMKNSFEPSDLEDSISHIIRLRPYRSPLAIKQQVATSIWGPSEQLI